jgi:polysaccharide export outer membrane protein
MLFLAMTPVFSAQVNDAKLGVGDTVHITVFQQADLTSDARIGERGTVAMPLIGEVKVAGLSQADAAKLIATELKKGKYLNNPQVTVALTTLRSRQVSVLGQVAHPGRFPLDDSARLTDVIAAAGGVGPTGGDTVTLIRNGESQKVDLTKNFPLQNGDTVYVERAPVFYVYGEVPRGGAYRLEPNMTVMQAIVAGGGITPRGSERRLKLRRTGPDGKVVESDAKPQDTVKADDVIFVKEALF